MPIGRYAAKWSEWLFMKKDCHLKAKRIESFATKIDKAGNLTDDFLKNVNPTAGRTGFET